jgi:Family of unknown function (DUF6665)
MQHTIRCRITRTLHVTMMKPDPLVEIEVGIQGDTAAALGRAGRSLGRAVEALAEFDNRGIPRTKERRALLHAAADALWAYVVQKEAIGITDHTKVNEVYGVTLEMWRLMGTSGACVQSRDAPEARSRTTPSSPFTTRASRS